MKKTLALILTAVLLLSLCCVNTAAAADLKVTITLDRTSCQAGSPVKATYSVTGGTGSYENLYYCAYSKDNNATVYIDDGELTAASGTSTFTPKLGQKVSVWVEAVDSEGSSAYAESQISMTGAPDVTPLKITITPEKTSYAVGSEITASYSITGGTAPYEIDYSCYAMDGEDYLNCDSGRLTAASGTIKFTPKLGQVAYIYIDCWDADGRNLDGHSSEIELTGGQVSDLKVTFTYDKQSYPVGSEVAVAYSITGGTPPYSDVYYYVYAEIGENSRCIDSGALSGASGTIRFKPTKGQSVWVEINGVDSAGRNFDRYTDNVPLTGDSVVDKAAITAFVTRCYEMIQLRSPDAGGLEYWVGKLAARERTAAQIVYEFIMSNEFKARGYNAKQVIEILYKAMQGREADKGGMTYWLGKINEGKKYADIVNGFCTSNEFKNLCSQYGITPGTVDGSKEAAPSPYVDVDVTQVRAFLSRCYQLMQKREPDDGGLDYWTKAIQKGKTAAEVVYEFINSNEFRARHLTNKEIAEILYQTALNRQAEADGLSYWLGRMDRGESLAAIVNGFCESNEFKAICAEYGMTPGKVAESKQAAGAYSNTPVMESLDSGKVYSFINRIYAAAFGREASEEEAGYWAIPVINGVKSPKQVTKEILTSNEFRAKGIKKAAGHPTDCP